MRSHRGRLILTIASVLAMPTLSLAETVEDVEKKIIAAYEKLTSYTANLKSQQQFDMGDGNFSKTEFTGRTEWMRQGGKILMRAEMKGTTESKFGDQHMKMSTAAMTVGDGEYVYTVTDTDGNKHAMKMKYDPAMTGDIAALIKQWHEQADLSLLPEEKVEGRDAYAIQVKPKTAGGPTDKSVFYMDRETGLMLRSVMFAPDGKESGRVSLTDIKVGADIKAERFKFEAPAGVEVVDMSSNQPPTGETP